MNPWQVRYGTNTLKRGHTGTYVTNLQTDLNKAGYPCGTADGTFGSKTETAVKNFQSANGLNSDGQVGSSTKPVLYDAAN